MADNSEREIGNGNDELGRDREQIHKEMDDAKKAANAEEAKKILADQLIRDLKAAKTAAKEFIDAESDRKTEDKRKEGRQVKRALIRAAEAAKDKDFPVTKTEQARELLAGLADQVLDDSTASAIEYNLQDYLTGEKEIVFSDPGQPPSDFQQAYKNLQDSNPLAAIQVAEPLLENPTVFGMKNNNEMIERLRLPKEGEASTPSSGGDEGSWNNDKLQYYGRFTPEQREFLHKLYNPDSFIDYVENEVEKSQEKTDQEKRVDVSDQIIKKLGQIMNQLYINLQIEAPKKFFEEVAQEDFMYGIVSTTAAIKRSLGRTLERLQNKERDKGIKKNFLYIHTEAPHHTEEKKITVKIDGKDRTFLKPVSRLNPLPQAKSVGASEFMMNVMNNLNHMQSRQEYLHNVRAMFNHPAGEQGFYGQLASYAEKLSGTDIDEMMLLPDGPLVYEAFVLYDKFLDEDFARLDWKHRAGQFSNQLERINTELEREVEESLKREYGNKYSEIEIRNAVNVAVGMSRGIFLNEPEKSAYADPMDIDIVTGKSKGLVASYSTNDAMSLTPFNPLHVIMRWGGEHHLNMYYFLPVGEEKMSWKFWDHTKTWDTMKKYTESYLQGRGDLAGKKLLIDELMDICNVGGPLKRKGWRMEYATKDYYEFDGDKLNVFKTFKALENIGYEVINDFFKGHLPDDFKKSAVTGDKYNLFKYLYENYFLKDKKEFDKDEFTDYLKDLRSEQREKAIESIISKKNHPESIDELIETNVTNEFLSRALSYEIAWRFPTKFLRMDRDRLNKDGVSRWRAIQEKMGLTRDEFDKVMKDLTFAETMMRKDMSEAMKEKVKQNPKLKLSEIGEIDNKLTEKKIRDLLGKVDYGGITEKEKQQRIDRAVDTYKLIWKEYISDKSDKGFIKEISSEIDKYPFTFGLEDTDFSFMTFRGAGPRIIPRAIGDIGRMERDVIPGIFGMAKLLNNMATDGKHDFSPIIEYLKKAQNAFLDVHGPGDAFDKFAYDIAASVISYFKKDTIAKPFFGIFGFGKRNSFAAEMAGRGSAVWEWDSRQIDRFCVALESLHLLRNQPYLLDKTPQYESYWFNFLGKPIKTPFKTRKVDCHWNSRRLRKEFGGTMLHVAFDFIDNLGIIVGLVILWQYIKKALEEVGGQKK